MTTAFTPFFATIGRHWFIPAALLILSGALVVSHTADWPSEARVLEGALIFDLAILAPLLFWICYRLKSRVAALRAVAMACGGIWLATYLVPPEHQALLPFMAFLRYGAIAVLVYVELRLMAVLYWSVIMGRVSPDQAAAHIAREAGIPDVIAGLVARELLFWQRVLARPIAFVRRRIGARDRS